MASKLPLRSHRSLPQFLSHVVRIRRQLAGSPGLVGYALDAHPFAKTFWTVSAWTSNAELGRFDRSDPHTSTKDSIRPTMLPTTFVFWTCRADELPVRWAEVRRRISQAET
ncbi:MAG TPA: hypothetical protein VFY11_12330 [Nocardioidaceae bacterium]|nr:hypothetical protein [Nocardioidaceae bacterium]